MKNIVFVPSGHPSPRPCASLQNSRVVEVVHSLLSLPLSRAASSHIFPVAGSIAAPAKSWASDVSVNGLRYGVARAAAAEAYLPAVCGVLGGLAERRMFGGHMLAGVRTLVGCAWCGEGGRGGCGCRGVGGIAVLAEGRTLGGRMLVVPRTLGTCAWRVGFK